MCWGVEGALTGRGLVGEGTWLFAELGEIVGGLEGGVTGRLAPCRFY